MPQTLTLDEAMQLLLKQSPILLRDRQNVAIATANLAQAGLRPNPSFELNSESYPLFESGPGPFFNNQELVLRTGQTIETAGKRGKRVQVARQELGVSESEVGNTIRQLKFELKRRYYTVVLAKAQRELAEEILKQFDEIIRLNEARFKQGEISGLEMNRVRAERLRFFTDLLDSDLQLKNAKTALLELLGVQTERDAVVECLFYRQRSPSAGSRIAVQRCRQLQVGGELDHTTVVQRKVLPGKGCQSGQPFARLTAP